MNISKWLILSLLVCYSPFLRSSGDLDFLTEGGGIRAKRYAQLCERFEKTYASEAPEAGIRIPFIYDTMWPFFCLEHLIHDSEGCSSWKSDQEGNLQPEFLKKGNALFWVDPTLIHRIGEKWRLIPKFDEDTDGHTCCDYGQCTVCNDTIIRDYWNYQTEGYLRPHGLGIGEGWIYYRCQCLKPNWWYCAFVGDVEHHTTCGVYCEEFAEKYPRWRFCKGLSIFPGYFNWSYQTYFPFFEQFLAYLGTNPVCSCYWPHCGYSANWISDISYLILDWLADFTSLRDEMASKKFSAYLNYDVIEEFVRGLSIHAYFYSHYHRIFSDIDHFSSQNLSSTDYQKIHEKLMIARDKIIPFFQRAYSECLQKHPHPKIYYEQGMIHFHTGSFLESLDDIRQWIAYAEANNYQALLTSDLYLQEGRLLSGLLSYDEAIVSLTKAIEKDSKNADAYFERAFAYFETGYFDKALADYLASGIRPIKVDPQKVARYNYTVLSEGIALGMLQGGQESFVEFVPSLLSSLRGMGRGLWGFISHPVEISQDLIDSAYSCIEFIKDNITKEKLCKLVPELQECLAKWNQLDDYTKGKFIGHVIGKYGVAIFMGKGSAKAISLYQDLRRANALMTLKTASISPKLAQQVIAQAAKEEAIRNKILRGGNLKIHWDRQGKHIPGKHNYDPKRSTLTHSDPQKLINKYAGSGRRINKHNPGAPGYKEVVDFKETIGIWKDKEGLMELPTTNGFITYSKDGVHIVPTRPNL